MKHPKTTFSLGILGLLLAALLVSGVEGQRAVASLEPIGEAPVPGAVLVVGGTRGTGLEVVRVLRERGDEVVVLAREGSDTTEAEKLGAGIVRGDALNPADVEAAFHQRGPDRPFRAVVSTLGGRSANGVRPDFDGNRNVIDAARAAGVGRFVLVTVIGAGESSAAAPWLSRRFLGEIMAEKTKAEDFLKASGLDYTIIRPGGLLDQDAAGSSYLTEDTEAMSWIRRADLALLTVRALDDPATIGRVYHAFDPQRTRFWSMVAD